MFFDTTTLQLAENLLGCVLVRETPRGRMAGVIVETEAYTENDAAAHSFGGKRTVRNEVMFKRCGYLYVYFTYGVHHCLNVVSEREGKGCAVLIRAIKPMEGAALMRINRGNKRDSDLTNGPGKLCQALAITLKHNGTDLTDAQSPIYLLDREAGSPVIKRTPRIGISRAKDKLWRFVVL